MLKLLSAGAGLLLIAGAAVAADARANKTAGLAFQAALTDTKDFDTAEKYLAPDYKQHKPTKEISTDGDYVILHVHFIGIPGTPGRAIADIYRLREGKIAEHWDVVQDVPTTAAKRPIRTGCSDEMGQLDVTR